MVKPFVICHILSSVDGKISGDFFSTNSASKAALHYGKIREEFAADAWLYGTTTTMEFLNYHAPDFSQQVGLPEINPNEDYIAESKCNSYFVAVDTEGILGWESGTFKRGKDEQHVVVLILETTSVEYRNYLKANGISYIISGEKSLDYKLALEKLNQYFEIQKVLICGGGLINWTFLNQQTIDQFSLVLAPLTDGLSNAPSIFERGTFPSTNNFLNTNIVEFSLDNAQVLADNCVWLNYVTIY